MQNQFLLSHLERFPFIILVKNTLVSGELKAMFMRRLKVMGSFLHIGISKTCPNVGTWHVLRAQRALGPLASQ